MKEILEGLLEATVENLMAQIPESIPEHSCRMEQKGENISIFAFNSKYCIDFTRTKSLKNNTIEITFQKAVQLNTTTLT